MACMPSLCPSGTWKPTDPSLGSRSVTSAPNSATTELTMGSCALSTCDYVSASALHAKHVHGTLSGEAAQADACMLAVPELDMLSHSCHDGSCCRLCASVGFWLPIFCWREPVHINLRQLVMWQAIPGVGHFDWMH